jgi:hypothetical protein
MILKKMFKATRLIRLTDPDHEYEVTITVRTTKEEYPKLQEKILSLTSK